MKNQKNIKRRDAIKTIALGSSAITIPKFNQLIKNNTTKLKGNIKQSVMVKWHWRT